MRYRNEKFFVTHQHWGWSYYIGPDSMTCWIIAKSQGFNSVGLYRISESVRAYAYLILSSQASARSSIIGNALTAQKAFLNNFKNVVNHRVRIQEDIKHYQDIISYASSKVNYSMGEGMLPSDMNLKIKSGTAGYNNKILASHSGFSLEKSNMVNTSAPEELAIKHPSFRNMPTKKSCPRQNTSQPSYTKRKDRFSTRSNWCLRNMVRFSKMR